MGNLVKKEDARVFTPWIDIVDKKDVYEIFADLPGVSKNGVEVRLDGDLLTVTGKVEPPDLGGLPLVRREYLTGDYEASFRISEGVDREKISAEIKDGVLVLTLPKAEAVKPRQIEVKAA